MLRTRARVVHKTKPNLCHCHIYSPVVEADISNIITQTNVYMLGEPVMVGGEFELVREVRGSFS